MKIKTLLVDDHEGMRTSFKLLFNSKGHYFESARNALEGIEKVKIKKYNIIMVDMSLFIGQERKSLTRIIREYQENAIIIGMSGEFKSYFNSSDLEDCDEFLQKGSLMYEEDFKPLFKRYNLLPENENKI